MKPLLACILLSVIVAAAPAQAPVHGHEVFITMDSDTTFGWSCVWWNLLVRDELEQLEVIDFDYPPLHAQPLLSVGFGDWGPIFSDVDGAYLFEPFSISSTVGPLAGIFYETIFPHPVTALNARGFTALGLSPLQRQGLRIARADGRAFTLEGLDYLGADADFEIGNELQLYADLAAFQSFSPVLGATTWNTLTLPPLPPNVPRVDLAPTGGLLQLSGATGMLMASSTVARIYHSDGSFVDANALDPLIGGAVSLTGSYTATDLVGFTDLAIGNATVTFVATDGAVLLVTASFQAGTPFFRFTGQPAALPTDLLPLDQVGPSVILRAGPANATLDSLALRLGHQPLTLQLERTPAGPRLHTLDKAPLPEPQGPMHVVIAPGDGSLHLGAFGLQPGASWRHLFDPNPVVAAGSGALFGMDFNGLTFQQLLFPAGVLPFHGIVAPNGTFAWNVPPGTLPVGFPCDLLFLENRPGVGLVPALERLVF